MARLRFRFIELMIIVGFVAINVFLASTLYMTYRIYPEIGMVVNSQCTNPLSGWTGTVAGFHVRYLKEVERCPDFCFVHRYGKISVQTMNHSTHILT
jgi:hypothetical protein